MLPLEGIRVVEAAQMIAGPLAGMVLAEQGAAPRLGEHTDAILAELGYGAEAIAALRAAGALGPAG